MPVTGCVLRTSMVTEKPSGKPGLGQQFLGLGDVELVGIFVELAEHALRQEGLVDLADALDQGRADRVVVDQIFEGLAHFRLGQVRVLLVEADVVDRALRRAGRREVGVLGDGVEIVGLEVAGDVDVAGLERQALAGAFLHVAVDDAGELGLLAVIIVVALQDDDFVGAPFAQLVRRRSRHSRSSASHCRNRCRICSRRDGVTAATCSMTSFLSTTEATVAVRQLSTKLGA